MAGGMGLTPGWETKTRRAIQCGQRERKRKKVILWLFLIFIFLTVAVSTFSHAQPLVYLPCSIILSFFSCFLNFV